MADNMATKSHYQGRMVRFTKSKIAIHSNRVQPTAGAPANEPSKKASTHLPTEILEHIASYCVRETGYHGKGPIPDYKALASLCRASRYFAKCFTPHLYRRIIFPDCKDQRKQYRRLLEILIFSPRLGNFIQEIDAAGSNLHGSSYVALYFDSVYEWIAHLYSTKFADYFRSVINGFPHAADSALAVLIVLAPQLRKLSWPVTMESSPVAAVFAWAQQYACPRALKSKDTRLLAKLETLHYNNGEKFSGQLQPPAMMSSTLQNLAITGLKYRTRHDPNIGDLLHHAESTWCTHACPIPTYRLPTLRTLTIADSKLTASTLTSILANAPHLESLTLRNIVFAFIHHRSTHALLSAGSLGIILRTYARSLKTLEISYDLEWQFKEKHPPHTLQHVGALGPLTALTHLTRLKINPEMVLGWQNLFTTPTYPSDTLHAALPVTSLENVCFDVSSRVPEDSDLGYMASGLREGFLHQIAQLMGAKERVGKLRCVYFRDNIFGGAPSDKWVKKLAALEGWGPETKPEERQRDGKGVAAAAAEDKKDEKVRRRGGYYADQKLPMVFYPRNAEKRIVNEYMSFWREEVVVVVGQKVDEEDQCVDPKKLCEEVKEWLYPDFEGDLGVKVYSRELAEEARRRSPEDTRAAFISMCTVGWSGKMLWELRTRVKQ